MLALNLIQGKLHCINGDELSCTLYTKWLPLYRSYEQSSFLSNKEIYVEYTNFSQMIPNVYVIFHFHIFGFICMISPVITYLHAIMQINYLNMFWNKSKYKWSGNGRWINITLIFKKYFHWLSVNSEHAPINFDFNTWKFKLCNYVIYIFRHLITNSLISHLGIEEGKKTNMVFGSLQTKMKATIIFNANKRVILPSFIMGKNFC